jgi:uncharacterized membrane-anchored protein
MSRHRITRRPTRPAGSVPAGAVKVPQITALFWVIKVLTTGMGEATSDYLGSLNLVLAGLIGVGGFALAMGLQFRAPSYRPATYWFAVAMVAVFGTMVADGLHVGLHAPYSATTIACALVVVAVCWRWHRSEGTLSIHSIVTRRRERFYWTTVLATFALGTAAGDLTATSMHLGFFGSGVLFAGAIAVPALAWRFLNLDPVLAFWTAYVITRPLGASFADWLGKPHSVGGGLGFGDGAVAGGSALAIVVLVGYLLIIRTDQERADGRAPTASAAPAEAAL